jgi:hypothetical protein
VSDGLSGCGKIASGTNVSGVRFDVSEKPSTVWGGISMLQTSISLHWSGKTPAALVAQPGAAVPHTMSASVSSGSLGPFMAGQFCVTPGGHCLNTPHSSPGLQSALSWQARIGETTVSSAHASSESLSNGGQVLPAAGASIGF